MSPLTEEVEVKESDTVQALVQLLRSRSYEEIRQRMYDSAPGSNWWLACRTELDIRNGEQTATALVVDTSAQVTGSLRGETTSRGWQRRTTRRRAA